MAATVPIQDAASILLIRDRAGHLEVLMQERAKTMAFMPGAFVFPGGKVDDSDRDISCWKPYANSIKGDDIVLRVCALRELYEEAEVLHTELADPVSCEGQSFEYCLRASKTPLNTRDMAFFAHWITPEGAKYRYDTRFYIAAHNGDSFVADGNEAMTTEWVRPSDLVESWETNTYLLKFPTLLILNRLRQVRSVEEAFTLANKEPVVCTRAWLDNDGREQITEEEAMFHFWHKRASDRPL